MTNTSVNNVTPVRIIDVDKALTVNKRIAQICAVSLGIALFGLTSCQAKLKNSMPIIDTRITCTNIKPIKYVKSDSDQTKRQIIVHNKVWDYYCDKEE